MAPPLHGAFLAPFYGGRAQGTFGCAGVLVTGLLTCERPPPYRLAATVKAPISVLGVTP